MALKILIVDDEALARSRLRTLLGDCTAPAGEVVGEASHAAQARQLLQSVAFDLVLLDIHMPGMDGIELARTLIGLPDAPALVFVTAHEAHAVTAFELDAVDYLTKPVRVERLQQALLKVERFLKDRRSSQFGEADGLTQETLLIQDRGRVERVPLAAVRYLKSEFKYLTVRTSARSYILEGSLSEFEERYAGRFVRVHRNALVALSAVRKLERLAASDDVEGWAVRLDGIAEPIAVSRRQLASVREALKEAP
jgi:two-component system response regulator AlgR